MKTRARAELESSAQSKVGFVVTKGTSNSTHLTVVYGTNKVSRDTENQVKLQRAHGGCLGTRRRRRTWKPAKSHGELDSSVDPWISEWGNPAGVMARHHILNT
jgi:hypothetical protein